MLSQRIKTAAIILPIVLAALFLGGWPLRLLLLALYIGIQFELLAFSVELVAKQRVIYCIVSCLLPLGYFYGGVSGAMCGAVIYAMFAFTDEVITINRAQYDGNQHVDSLAAVSLSISYTGLFGTVLIAGADGAAFPALLLLLLCVIACDTGAYFSGRAFGKTKLAPRISPQKTIAGAYGGMAGAILTAVCLHYAMQFPFQWQIAVMFGAAIGALAIAGDLVGSLVKRCYGKKDSGTILPGHGGVLDRVNALIFAAPLLLLLRHWW